MAIMRGAIVEDIEWSPSIKKELLKLQEKKGKNVQK